jgi:uncharacterized membrane protein
MTSLLHQAMQWSAVGIEVLAVAVIVLGIVVGTVRFLLRVNRSDRDEFKVYKTQLVKALLLGLEFLVAADIVRTVALEATLQNVAILGALVVVRTFLSWSLVVEVDGVWPWEAGRARSLPPSPREDA